MSEERKSNGAKHHVNFLDNIQVWADSNIRLIQNTLYIIGGVGAVIVARSIYMTVACIKPTTNMAKIERTTSIVEHVTCSICMDLYVDPLALPCLHSFCKRCIQGLFSSALVFKCPECRHDVTLGPKGVDGLPKNFQLRSIVDSYKSENSSQKALRGESHQQLCSQHRTSCQFQCQMCKTTVCIKCIVGKHSGHKMTLLSTYKDSAETAVAADVRCSTHGRGLVVCCTDCEALVCVECIVTQHSGHCFKTVEETHSYNLELLNISLKELEARQRLLKATQKTCRTLVQKTQTDAQKKRQDLEAYFSRLRDAVDRREAVLRSQLDRKEQDITQNYVKKSEDAQRKEKLVARAADDVKRLVTENKVKLLMHYPETSKRISELLSDERTDCPPQQTGIDEVTLMTCHFEKELENVQWQWPKEERRPARKAPPIPAVRKSISDRTGLGSTIRENQAVTVGTSVQRGKDWRDGMADGGPGHIGTVVHVCLDPDTYAIRWPNGKEGIYKYAPPCEEEISLP